MNHERLCKYNPTRQYTPFHDLQFQKNKCGNGGENQYTKAIRLGLSKPTVSQETRKKISITNKNRSSEWNKENGKKIAATINKKISSGEWHVSLAKKLHYNYNGVDLHGTWELKYAKFLDSKNISWIRNKKSFTYIFENQLKKYTPDFYLPNTNEYIEIKGYETIKDKEKWKQFPTTEKLVVLKKKDLIEIGVL